MIGAVLVPGAKAPKLVTNELVARMKPGSVLVDIAIDQGGCFEDSRPTTHDDPTYRVHDSVFYCVANMPGAVPHTSTYALTNVTAAVRARDRRPGLARALRGDPALALGLNTHEGHLTNLPVAEAQRDGGGLPGAGAEPLGAPRDEGSDSVRRRYRPVGRSADRPERAGPQSAFFCPAGTAPPGGAVQVSAGWRAAGLGGTGASVPAVELGAASARSSGIGASAAVVSTPPSQAAPSSGVSALLFLYVLMNLGSRGSSAVSSLSCLFQELATTLAGEPRVGAQEHVVAGGQLLQPVHLGLGQVRLVGDPHGAVLHRVDGVLVVDRLIVNAAVLPRRSCARHRPVGSPCTSPWSGREGSRDTWRS